MAPNGDPGRLRRVSSRLRAVAQPPAPHDAVLAEAEHERPPGDDDAGLSDIDLHLTGMPRSVWTWFRLACITVTLFAGYQLLLVLGGVAGALLRVCLYVVFGAIIGFLAGPTVDALERVARIPRTLAIIAVLFGGIAAVAVLGYFIAGAAFSEASGLASRVPDYVHRGQSFLDQANGFLTSHGVHPPSNDVLAGKAGEISSQISGLLVSSVTYTLNIILDTVIIFVVAFWLLKDGETLRAGLTNLIPSSMRSNLDFALDAIGVVIGGYVRAQLFMALMLGSAAGLGCAALGVPFPIVVAATAGVFELIPLVGPFVGGAVAILLAATVSVNLAILTVLLFLVLHLIEGYVLGPRVQEKFIHLHPLIALLALFGGVEAAGFLGALFAVPACSLAAVFIRAAVGDWRANRPDLFTARDEDVFVEGRRRRLLREFRLFKRSPMDAIQKKPDR